MSNNTLFFLMIAVSVSAAAAEYPLRQELPAPNQQYLAVITQPEEAVSPTILIQDKSGQPLLKLETGIMQFYSETARWSPDSQILAIAGGYHGLQEPLVFVREGGRFVSVDIPYRALEDRYDNALIRPVRWITGHRLILNISGPFVGHAGYHLHGRVTIRVLTNPPEYEVLYKKITQTYDEES